MAGLGHGSEHMWVVMGEVQGLCGWSWERIRAYVGGLGRGSRPKLAVLGHDLAGKWPKLERGQDPTGSGIRKGRGSEGPEGSERSEGRQGPERSEAQSQFVQEISRILVFCLDRFLPNRGVLLGFYERQKRGRHRNTHKP